MTETTLQDRWDAMASLHQNAEAMVADGVMEGFAKTVVAGGAVTLTEEEGRIYPALGDAMIGSVVKDGRLHKLLQRSLEAEKAKAKKPFRKLIALDFDGVLHSYTSPWTDAATISDPPTPCAMEFLRDLVEDGRFEVCIVSSRCKEPAGITAIGRWLMEHLLQAMHPIKAEEVKARIEIVAHRPPATVTIDDRALTFMGEWPSLDRLAAFTPWNKKPAHLRPDPLTSVAAIDALMQRIGRVAKETGCPEDMQALDWLEESARLRRQGLLDWAKAELAKDPAMDPSFIADEAQTRRFLETMHEADLLVSFQRLEDEVYRRKESGRIPFEDGEPGSDAYEGLLDHVVGRIVDQAVAGAEGMPAAGTEAEKAALRLGAERALGLLCIDPAVRIEVHGEIVEGDDDRPTVDGVPVMSVDELPKPGGDDEEDGEPGFCGIAFFRDGDRIKAIRQTVDEDDDEMTEAEVEYMLGALDWFRKYVRSLSPKGRKWQESLDREFAPHAAVERIIVDAVPPGTPISRASAGGDLGWRIGFGWMPVEGSDPSQPERIRDFARNLSAIPGLPGEKPRAGDPELVRRTLAAGRAL